LSVLGDVLWWILFVYLFLVVARVFIEWLPVRWPRAVRPVVLFIHDVTEPALSPLRRVLPIVPLGGGAGLDLSPLVVIVVIFFLQWLVRVVFG
jgi:YggT family protein